MWHSISRNDLKLPFLCWKQRCKFCGTLFFDNRTSRCQEDLNGLDLSSPQISILVFRNPSKLVLNLHVGSWVKSKPNSWLIGAEIRSSLDWLRSFRKRHTITIPTMMMIIPIISMITMISTQESRENNSNGHICPTKRGSPALCCAQDSETDTRKWRPWPLRLGYPGIHVYIYINGSK